MTLKEISSAKTLTVPQDDFIFSTNKYVCVKGTWGCGKSMAGLLSANRECEENAGNLYLVIRQEYVDLKDSTMKDWMDWVGRPIVSNDVKYPNGSILMFRHGDDINALKNVNLGGALMVQAEEMVEEDFWFLTGRLRRQQGSRQLRVECNYDGHNWIYKLFNEQKVGQLITTNTFDNEVNLPADYIPNLKKLPKKLRDRHLYGSDEDMEGAVWDEFDRGRHLRDPFIIPEGWDRFIALDHGFTNPTAVVFGAVDWDGNLFIYDEHYEAGKVASYHADAIKRRDITNVKRLWIDPSCRNKTQRKGEVLYSIVEEYADCGLLFDPANNSVLAGINRVNEGFKADKIFIFKNCTNTIREVESYKWKKLKPTDNKNRPEEPHKKDDHACDALRYLVMSRIEATEKDTEIPLNPMSAWGRHLLEQKKKEDFIYG